MSRVVDIPAVALVVLVGASGSGKSTFARRHFAPTQVLSSDVYRGMVADDENDQTASNDAFDALHHVAGIRLRRGLLTVVDATNVTDQARAQLVRIAREHDVLPVAVVLDMPVEECVRRNASRPDRDFGAHVVRRHASALKRSLPKLQREGFRGVHVLRGTDEIEGATVTFSRLLNDFRDLTGLPPDELAQLQDAQAHHGPRDPGLRIDLLAAFAQLAPLHREVLLLVGVEQLSYAECAEVLQIPAGTVMSRLSRARAALRQALDGAPPARPPVPLKRVV